MDRRHAVATSVNTVHFCNQHFTNNAWRVQEVA
jgi:hypothetical protein